MTLTPKRREALAAALEERRCPQAKEHGVCMHELCYEDKFAAAAMRALERAGEWCYYPEGYCVDHVVRRENWCPRCNALAFAEPLAHPRPPEVGT